ncbi:MAG: chemotaxis protein CheA [Halobacteriota archaeon]
MSDKIDISQYLNAFLEETQEHLQAFTQAMIEFEDADGECAAEVLNTAFRAAHTVKGMSASMDFMNMERLCHSMEDLLDELRSGSHSVTPELIDLLLECSTKLEELTIYIEENGTDDIDVSEVLSELDKVKVNGEGERAKDKRGKAKKAEKKEDLSSKLEKSKVKGKEAAVKSVRISIDKLDTVGNLVGELVINKSRLIQIGREHEIEELSSTMAVVERTISDLQYAVTQMRMIPVEHVFNRFPKLVRDLYRAQGKEVDFIVKGKEIELDRTILDEIVDPIVHLLRNSVDHGIELPEVREEAGKERIGRITLAAKRETGHVTICVEDDGKGMDPRILRDKAVSKGLLSADEVAKLSDDDAFKLIFMPGFSTAEKTTAVSGRGVGMEVVKTKIEALGGFVHIQSEKDKGTRVLLKLPLTTAIIHALLIDIASLTLA